MATEIETLSRNKISSLITSGYILVNGTIVKDVNFHLKIKDRITIKDDLEIEKLVLTPDSSVEFSILYEDEDLLIVNKPAGVVVHPGAGNKTRTLVNGLLHRCGEFLSNGSSEYRPGIVHRIDKDTSGILVVAKNDFSHADLAKQFADHSIKRKYICFCHSVLKPINGKIETLIARDRHNRLKMSVSQNHGKNAITIYKTLKIFSKFASKIECELKTGRTHQIRVHISHLGNSLIGDSLYKVKNYPFPKEISNYINNFSRQALHAYFLEFAHPRSKNVMTFEINLPLDMQELEKVLINANN